MGDDRLRGRDFLMYHFTTRSARPRMVMMERGMMTENVTRFNPRQKLLYLSSRGPKIVTFREQERFIEKSHDCIYVEEFDGYADPSEVFSLDEITNMFDSYDEKEKRRWRAIHDGITPAVMLSNEEIDKIIDDNKEWCKAYEKRQREWSREDAEAKLLDQIPEDQRHTDDDEDEDDDEYDDLGGPSHVMGSSPTCQP